MPMHDTNAGDFSGLSQRTADAKNRTLRTLLQGGAAVVTVAIIGAVLDWLASGDLTYRTLGVSAGTAGLTALYSFLHRTVLDPSPIPSALPPGDPGEPDAEAGATDLGTVVLVVCLVVLLVFVLGGAR